MKYVFFLITIVFFWLQQPTCSAEELQAPQFKTPYGHNQKAGRTLSVNGIQLYVETYGKGIPLLLLHGNAADISTMGYQIDYFSKNYQIIAIDSRGHGKSEMGEIPLTYEQMAEDINAALDLLNIKSANVVGWSDGGIVALLLAIHHPDKVAKAAIMGANLNPQGAYPWALNMVGAASENAEAMIAKGDQSQPWKTMQQHLNLLGKQPNISLSSLNKVLMPILVMAGDRDVIRDTHTLDMFHGLPQSQLCIFPGATHMIPWQDHERFNQTVKSFFSKPFEMPDTESILAPAFAQ